MTIGEMIKDLRKKAGLTQCELAKKMNVSASHISQYECGQRNPSINQLKKFADALDVALDTFITCRIDAIKTKSEKADPDITNQFSQAEFEEKLSHIGYRLIEDSGSYIIVDNKNTECETTLERILEINDKCNQYLKFILFEEK